MIAKIAPLPPSVLQPYVLEIANHLFGGSSGGRTSFTTFLSRKWRLIQLNCRLNRVNHRLVLAAARAPQRMAGIVT